MKVVAKYVILELPIILTPAIVVQSRGALNWVLHADRIYL